MNTFPAGNGELVNRGRLVLAGQAEELTIEMGRVTNEGTIVALEGTDAVLDGRDPVLQFTGDPWVFNTSPDSVLMADGGRLRIGSAFWGDEWTNRGTLRARHGGALILGGRFTLADTTVLDGQGGAIQITRTWDAAGQTFTLNPSTGDLHLIITSSAGTLERGTIVGGTIVQNGAHLRFHPGTATLDGVHLVGDLVLDQPGSRVIVRNGTNWTGDLRLESDRLELLAEQDLALDNRDLTIDYDRTLIEVSGRMTLGPDAEVRLNGAAAEGNYQIDAAELVNRGWIVADNAAGVTPDRSIRSGEVVSEGTITARHGAALRLDGTLRPAGGVVEALDGSSVRIQRLLGTDVGTMRTEGSGTITLTESWDLDGQTLITDTSAIGGLRLDPENIPRLSNGRILGNGTTGVFTGIERVEIDNIALAGEHRFVGTIPGVSGNPGFIQVLNGQLVGEENASLTIEGSGDFLTGSSSLEIADLTIHLEGFGNSIRSTPFGVTGDLTLKAGTVVNAGRFGTLIARGGDLYLNQSAEVHLNGRRSNLFTTNGDIFPDGLVTGNTPFSPGEIFMTDKAFIDAGRLFVTGTAVARGEGRSLSIVDFGDGNFIDD